MIPNPISMVAIPPIQFGLSPNMLGDEFSSSSAYIPGRMIIVMNKMMGMYFIVYFHSARSSLLRDDFLHCKESSAYI